MDDTEAEVLLQVPAVTIDEIERPPDAPPSVGSRRTVVQSSELLVLSMTFTAEQLERARKDLHMAPDMLAAEPGHPVVVILCGEYRIPLQSRIPVRAGSPLSYVVYVPDLAIGINLAPSTAPEVVEAFEFIIRTYAKLESGAIPSLPTEAVSAPRAVSYSGAYAPASGGCVAAPLPPPIPSTHASLEEQQQAALREARSQTEYIHPQRLPGSSTMIVQTMPDLPRVAKSTRIAHGIANFSAKATRIISGATDLAARGIATGTDGVISHTEKCTHPVQVPEAARNGIHTTRTATQGIVAVSGAFATAVLGVSSLVGGQIGGRLRTRVPQSQEPSSLDGVKEVGIATVGAALTIADAAIDGARAMLTASCDGVTRIVTHKLGDDAGHVTADGLGIGQDAFNAAANLRQAGIKSVAKATLKNTAQTAFQ